MHRQMAAALGGSDARFDAIAFYSLASASFLESTTPIYVENMQVIFANDDETRAWLATTWQADEQHHGQLLREFIERTWPEFDYEASYSRFLSAYVPRCDASLLRANAGLEALSRCVTETYAAMYYRMLAAHTNDAELKALLTQLSRDEVHHFQYFRKAHERNQARERSSLRSRVGVIIERSKLAADEDAGIGFRYLNEGWSGEPPFTPLDYETFWQSAARVFQRHYPFAESERMLLAPFKGESRATRVMLRFVADVVRWQAPRQIRRKASRRERG
jgi:hypothetical protein